MNRKTKKIIVGAVAGVLVVGGLVFGVMVWLGDRLDYAGASRYVDDLMETQAVVTEFLEEEPADYEELDKELLSDFEGAVRRIGEYYVSLGASSALKNDEVKAKYDELGEMTGKLEEMSAVARWLMDFMEITEADGYAAAVEGAQVKAPNEFAVEMAREMSEYAAAVQEFAERYGEGVADDYGEMTEEYGALVIMGEELEEKYREVSLAEVVGVTEVDVSEWFEKLGELKMLLDGKK